ncbi:MAG: hypothetical protein HY321_04805 [Armatimonadetes bacterium]|nr:hypothetical protein [Armatimonadota bacterium]
MKLVTVIYDGGIDEAVMEQVDAMKLSGWTRFFDAHGFGGTGLKRGDQVFPGLNNILLAALPDERVVELHRRLRKLQESFRLKPGITILAQPVEELGPAPPEDE